MCAKVQGATDNYTWFKLILMKKARKESKATTATNIIYFIHMFNYFNRIVFSWTFSLTKLDVVMNLTPSRNIELWNFYSAPKECANEIETNEHTQWDDKNGASDIRCSLSALTHTTTSERYVVWFSIVRFRFIFLH